MTVLGVVRTVEERTGHGSWGTGRFEERRDAIPELTAELGHAWTALWRADGSLNG